MSVRIGDAYSMNDPESETITPDDRQTAVEVLDGVVVQDFGIFNEGMKIEWTLQFRAAEFAKLLGHWANRDIVTVVDTHGGESFTARVLVKSYEKIAWFRDKAVKAKIELWRV